VTSTIVSFLSSAMAVVGLCVDEGWIGEESCMQAEGGLLSAREEGRRMVQGVTKDQDSYDVGQAARRGEAEVGFKRGAQQSGKTH
jgi:hypothetical protein